MLNCNLVIEDAEKEAKGHVPLGLFFYRSG
jgi:hypothetical protein